MSEQARTGPNQEADLTGASAEVNSANEAFIELRSLSLATRVRLGLKPGWHVFDLPGPDYEEISFSDGDAAGDVSIGLVTAKREVATSTNGNPYFLRSSIDLSGRDGDFSYSLQELLIYTSSYSDGETDAELESSDEQIEASEQLSDNIARLVADVRRILPTLTLDQYNREKGYNYGKSHYDPEWQKQLEELAEALSTAGGAYSILSQSIKNERQKQLLGGEIGERDEEFELPKSEASSQKITGVYYPDTGDEYVWDPQIIIIEPQSTSGYSFSTYSSRFSHTTSHYLTLDPESQTIGHEVADNLVPEEDRGAINIDQYDRGYEWDEKLPGDVFEIAKRALKAICTAGMGFKEAHSDEYEFEDDELDTAD